MKKKQRLKVEKNAAGQTLLAFLRDHLKEFPSVKAIKRAIDAKQCAVNGRVEVFSTYKVCEGEEITISLEERLPSSEIQILYEDEEILACNKPSGISSEKLTLGMLVHRLDKETSGALLFAKSHKAKENLEQQFAKRTIEKKYLVICDGQVTKKEWTSVDFLGKKAVYQGGVIYGRVPKEKGKRAETHFSLLCLGKRASLLEAFPITGRTHQIRVQLSLLGHPVLGDWQYAKKFRCDYLPSRILLHAYQLRFSHPSTEKKLFIQAPLPKDFLDGKKNLFPKHNEKVSL